jgi:NTE family protein
MEEDRKRDVMRKIPRLISWFSMLNFNLRRPGLVQADTFLQNFIDDLETKTFEDLEIPLTIVATDYWTGEEVVLNSGPLKPAMTASSAIPGIFPAVEHQGRVLVDGSLSNAVPFSHFCQGDDPCVAIDVAPHRVPKKKKVPSIRDASEGMFDIFFDKMVEHQKKESPPDVYFRPGIENVGILDFDKVEDVYKQVEAKFSELQNLCYKQGLKIKGFSHLSEL